MEKKSTGGKHYFQLSFKGNLEKKFIHEYFTKSLTVLRICFATGIAIYASFGLLDAFLLPVNERNIFWTIRYSVVAVFLLVWALSYRKKFYKYWQLVIAFCIFLAGFSLIVMMSITKVEFLQVYFVGLLLVLVYGYTFVQLRFLYAIVSCMLFSVIYILAAFTWYRLPLQTAVTNTSFLIGANVLAGFASFIIEKFARQDFISRLLLNEEREKVHEANRMLEKRVRERTSLLEKANKDLVVAIKKAEESDKLKSAFLANLSHEIRTPMNGIMGFSNLLRRKNITSEKTKKYVQVINERSSHLLKLINDMVDISKIESGQLELYQEDFCLNEMLDELLVAILHERDMSKKRNIKVALKKGLKDQESYIHSDMTRLKQVFSNLLNNALKFTHRGMIEFGYQLKDKNTLLLHVKDTGIGVEKDKQQIIFDRFRQSDDSSTKKYSGTGLGLAISKSIVQQLGGNIWLVSDINVGSTFYISLPYSRPDNIDTRNEKEDGITPGKQVLRNKNILVVEDDPKSYEYLVEILEEYDIQLHLATDGKRAVDIFRDNGGFDMVLMDLQLPRLNGFEATRLIREKDEKIPIIAQTAYAMHKDKEKAMKAGCNDFITKPVRESELVKIMENHLLKRLA